jgi:hypothetical protein
MSPELHHLSSPQERDLFAHYDLTSHDPDHDGKERLFVRPAIPYLLCAAQLACSPMTSTKPSTFSRAAPARNRKDHDGVI